MNNRVKFNIFSFISTFARVLVETYISMYLFKNGFSIRSIVGCYALVNFISFFLSYIFVRIGNKTNYSFIMIIGLISFLGLQLHMKTPINSLNYLIILAFLYSAYRRGYWVARKFYITQVMPTKKSSTSFSIILVLSQIATIVAGYVGSFILNNYGMFVLSIISSLLLFISVIPLFGIKYEKNVKKIELFKHLKKYNKVNAIAFAYFEINNLLTFIFPIYIALYINNSYTTIGNINAISNVAIILFILIYGKVINDKRNYLILSSLLVIACSILKLIDISLLFMIVCFIDGLATKMQYQSINKLYFEDRNKMDITHYNLIYQMLECGIRAIVTLPLVFFDNIRLMILVVLGIQLIIVSIYVHIKNNKDLEEQLML